MITFLDPQRLGLIFGLSYCIAYTCSRTLANQYGYNALKIGLVLLSFGVGESGCCLPILHALAHGGRADVGCLGGSVLGGRYSDYVFRKLKAENGGTSAAEVFFA